MALTYWPSVAAALAKSLNWLVGAVGVHRVPVVQAAQRRGHLDAHLGEGVCQHVLERAHDVVLLDEAHLDVHLRELGLAVCAQVLVAEALGDLVVALDAADHEELLQELRGLRQRVEVAGLGAARHKEVARALGRGLEERRGLHLEEVAVVQRLTQGEGEIGAHLEVGRHARATQVEVAVAQADVLGGVHMVLDLEGRRLGGVEDLDGVNEDLDLAGGELGVLHALGALADDARDLDGPLGADSLGRVEGLAARVLRVKGDLRHALAVAQVNKDEAAVVATVPDPTGQRDLLPDVLAAQLSAGVGVHAVGIHMMPFSSCRPVSYGRRLPDGCARVDGERRSGADCTTGTWKSTTT